MEGEEGYRAEGGGGREGSGSRRWVRRGGLAAISLKGEREDQLGKGGKGGGKEAAEAGGKRSRERARWMGAGWPGGVEGGE